MSYKFHIVTHYYCFINCYHIWDSPWKHLVGLLDYGLFTHVSKVPLQSFWFLNKKSPYLVNFGGKKSWGTFKTGLTPVLFAMQFKKYIFKLSKIVYFSFMHFTKLLSSIFSVKMNFLSYCHNHWKKSTKGKQNKSSEDVFILDGFKERDLTKWWRNFVNIFCNDFLI